MSGEETWWIDMATNRDCWIDMRLFFYDSDPDEWNDCLFKDYRGFFKQSPSTKTDGVNNNICYSVEAIKYAQTAFLLAIVHLQWANLIICKTRTLSIGQQYFFANKWSTVGVISETLLVAALIYIPPLNIVLATWMLIPQHFMVPAMPFFMMHYAYDEIRKLYLWRGMDQKDGRLKGWVAQNTLY